MKRTLFTDDFNSYTIGEYGSYDGNMSWYYWDGTDTKQKIISSYNDEENNNYITLKDRSGATTGLNTGGNMTFSKGITYSISFDAKSETSQTLSLDPTENMTYTLDNPTISNEDGWKTITGTLKFNDDYTENTLTVGIWFQTAAGSWTKDDFSLDNVNITYDDGTPATDPVAKVGDKEYTSLDDAIDNANYETITLLDDATLEKARKWATATIDGDGHTITVATPKGTVGSAIFNTLTLSNATLTGSTNQNIANDAYLTDVTVDDLNYDCLALNNFTATDCNLEHNGGVYLFAGNIDDGKLSMTDTTITVNSLGWTKLLFKVPNNDKPTLSNVTINGLTATGTTIAGVNNNTSIDGIKVNGLADTQELKIVDGNLVIADKAMPASFTAMVGKAEVKNGTGDLANTVATGFQATIKNTDDTEGSFNTVNWNVTFNNETKTTGDRTITKVTLPKDADVTIALIIDGLNGADATAEVSVK